jgi:hypothetical protein
MTKQLFPFFVAVLFLPSFLFSQDKQNAKTNFNLAINHHAYVYTYVDGLSGGAVRIPTSSMTLGVTYKRHTLGLELSKAIGSFPLTRAFHDGKIYNPNTGELVILQQTDVSTVDDIKKVPGPAWFMYNYYRKTGITHYKPNDGVYENISYTLNYHYNVIQKNKFEFGFSLGAGLGIVNFTSIPGGEQFWTLDSTDIDKSIAFKLNVKYSYIGLSPMIDFRYKIKKHYSLFTRTGTYFVMPRRWEGSFDFVEFRFPSVGILISL